MALKLGVADRKTALLLASPLVIAAAMTAGGLQHVPSSAAVAAAVLFASFASGIAGFAFSATCGAILFHIRDDPLEVVQIMVLCSTANQAWMVAAIWRQIEWPALRPFVIGGLCGVPMGIYGLLHADRHIYTAVLGFFLLAFGLYTLLSRPRLVALQHPALDGLAGFLGGLTGGAAGFPSATVTIWCGLRGWDKARQRALCQPFILLMQVAALACLCIVRHGGQSGAGLAFANLIYVPAGLLGTWMGTSIFKRMSGAQFRIAVNALLIVCGVSFIL